MSLALPRLPTHSLCCLWDLPPEQCYDLGSLAFHIAASYSEGNTDRGQTEGHWWWNGRRWNDGEEIVPSSDDSDRDDRGQLHFAGVFHVSVDFEGFPIEVSELMYDELDEGKRRFTCTFTIPSKSLVIAHKAEVDPT